jgi:hypothetical protein
MQPHQRVLRLSQKLHQKNLKTPHPYPLPTRGERGNNATLPTKWREGITMMIFQDRIMSFPLINYKFKFKFSYKRNIKILQIPSPLEVGRG